MRTQITPLTIAHTMSGQRNQWGIFTHLGQRTGVRRSAPAYAAAKALRDAPQRTGGSTRRVTTLQGSSFLWPFVFDVTRTGGCLTACDRSIRATYHLFDTPQRMDGWKRASRSRVCDRSTLTLSPAQRMLFASSVASSGEVDRLVKTLPEAFALIAASALRWRRNRGAHSACRRPAARWPHLSSRRR
jgi:hypothetical protein